jgi:hypothetical protein
LPPKLLELKEHVKKQKERLPKLVPLLKQRLQERKLKEMLKPRDLEKLITLKNNMKMLRKLIKKR